MGNYGVSSATLLEEERHPRQGDIHADIGATDIGARFTTDIRGCADNSTRTSVITDIRNYGYPNGYPQGQFDPGYFCLDYKWVRGDRQKVFLLTEKVNIGKMKVIC